jgi:hypothetical protein
MGFGWGKATYGGAAKGGTGAIPGAASFYVPSKNNKGEDQIVVPISLPSLIMERFIMELDCFLTNKPVSGLKKIQTSKLICQCGLLEYIFHITLVVNFLIIIFLI